MARVVSWSIFSVRYLQEMLKYVKNANWFGKYQTILYNISEWQG